MDTYRPLSEVRDELRINWHRSPVERSLLRELTTRHDVKGWAQTLGHLALFLGSGTITFLLWSRQIWIGFAFAMFLHGTVTSFLRGIAPHELAHGTVFRTKWLNKVFLYFFSMITWWNHIDYALSHTYHHRYTLHPDGDREVLLPLKPALSATTMLQLVTVNLFGRPGRTFSSGGLIATVLATARAAAGLRSTSPAPSRVWVRALHADHPTEARKSMWWSRGLVLFHAAVLAISIITGYWVISLLISVAPFTANLMLYLVGQTQHCGVKDNDSDFRKCARSIRLGPVLGFLYWRMNWHAEHHMYAAVPCYNLKNLSQIIADDMPKPETLIGAWREMRDTWKRQQSDSGYQFDRPVPARDPTGEGPAEAHRGPDSLEQSIGGLAPEDLS